jgi:hypothetical protein
VIGSIAIKCAETLAETCLYSELHKIGLETVWLIAAVVQYTVG